MTCYPESDSCIRDKVKQVLDLSSHAAKKNQNKLQLLLHLIQLLKKDFITLKAEVDKLYINKLVNVPTSLNNSKIKVDDLYVGKLKTAPINLKKLSDVVNKKSCKNQCATN